MYSKRIATLALLAALATVPAAALPKPADVVGRKGQVQGAWCYGVTFWECDPTWANDDHIVISWGTDGTWLQNGKIIRATSGAVAAGTKIGPDTYQIGGFDYTVYVRRTGFPFERGWCFEGTATIRTVIKIDLKCYYFKDPNTLEQVMFPLHILALNERKPNDLLTAVVTPVLELAGLGPGCSTPCPAPFEGVYY